MDYSLKKWMKQVDISSQMQKIKKINKTTIIYFHFVYTENGLM